MKLVTLENYTNEELAKYCLFNEVENKDAIIELLATRLSSPVKSSNKHFMRVKR